MKVLKSAFSAVCILFLMSAAAVCEGFFSYAGEIMFSESCPEGYTEIGETLRLGQGETRTITNEAKYFSSRNYDVVSIDDTGVLTAQKPGKTTVCVYFADNIRKDLLVEVSYAPKSIKLSEKKLTLEVGASRQLKATLTKSTMSTVSWSSSAPDILSVDNAGRITALRTGECTVTARTHNGLSAACKVTVKTPSPAKIRLSDEEITLYSGETASVSCSLEGSYMETITWSTGDPGIASVDQTGNVTAVSPGRTVVCLEASGGDVRFVDVIVKEGSTSVTFLASELSLYVGGRAVFEPLIEGGSGKYEYYSMDPSIAYIDPATGEICAVTAGSVYILGVTPNFVFGEFLLTVVEGPEALVLSCGKNEIAIGESLVTSHNLDAYEPQFVWYESSDHTVAQVDEYGVITGAGKGRAVISIHCGGLVGEAEITVLPPAEKISAFIERDMLGAGESIQINYSLEGGTGAVEYASSDIMIAQIDAETGTLYALNPGTCQITLTVSSGAETSFPVTVCPAPESVFIEKNHYTLAAGNRHYFRFSTNEGSVSSCRISSSAPSLVWYEDGYLMCGNEPGNAVITVQTHNGIIAACGITVLDAPDQIHANAEKLTSNPHFDYYVLLKEGECHPLNAFIDSVPDIEITYQASHPEIADVDAQGIITAKKPGTSLITVSLISDVTAEILVSVE